MDKTPNPYSAPTVNPTARSNPNSPLANFRSADIKKLRNNSHTIRVIGILGIIGWFLIVALAAYQGNLSGQIIIFNIIMDTILYLGIVAIISSIGIYSLLARPSWGKVVSIIYCALLILSLSLFSILIGIFGIIALSHNRSHLLFGPKKILHSVVDKEFKLRKKEGRIK